MGFLKAISLPSEIILIALYFFTCTNAFTFDIQNNCPYTIWAAAFPGAGKRLEPKSSWTTDVNPPGNNNPARIWARTKCTFDGTRKGCETGDCNGLLQCQSFGTPPYTLAEFIPGGSNVDFYDISLLDGFNVPMTIRGCNQEIKCAADIKGACPNSKDLKVTGGCKNPCAVFNTPKYCGGSVKTQPTEFSKIFKDKCPDAFTYPDDDTKGKFTCPTGICYCCKFFN